MLPLSKKENNPVKAEDLRPINTLQIESKNCARTAKCLFGKKQLCIEVTIGLRKPAQLRGTA